MPRKQRKLLGRYVIADPEICHGKPTFLGTRIMVAQVLKQVAKGMPWDAISAEWQGSVTKDAIAEAVELAQRAFEDHAVACSQVEELMAQKSRILSKAQALATMGLSEIAQPLWASAASYEERIASLLDADGESLEAAVHRISAASCYQKAGDPSRATSLYRAALAGPLRDVTRSEVEQMLTECLAVLWDTPPGKSVNASAD